MKRCLSLYVPVSRSGTEIKEEIMKRREFMRDSFIGASALSNLESSLRRELPKTEKGSNSATPATEEDNSSRASVASLSQHFIDPSGSISPWMFIPQENIKSISTTEHLGFVTIREAGHGKGIKGVLKDPITLSKYRMPWAFHLGV